MLSHLVKKGKTNCFFLFLERLTKLFSYLSSFLSQLIGNKVTATKYIELFFHKLSDKLVRLQQKISQLEIESKGGLPQWLYFKTFY